MSLLKSQIPHRWKHSIVSPVKEKPPFSNPSNYRAISISFLPFFEKVLAKEIENYYIYNNILPDEKFGFHSKRFIEQLMFLFLDGCSSEIDRR